MAQKSRVQHLVSPMESTNFVSAIWRYLEKILLLNAAVAFLGCSSLHNPQLSSKNKAVPEQVLSSVEKHPGLDAILEQSQFPWDDVLPYLESGEVCEDHLRLCKVGDEDREHFFQQGYCFGPMSDWFFVKGDEETWDILAEMIDNDKETIDSFEDWPRIPNPFSNWSDRIRSSHWFVPNGRVEHPNATTKILAKHAAVNPEINLVDFLHVRSLLFELWASCIAAELFSRRKPDLSGAYQWWSGPQNPFPETPWHLDALPRLPLLSEEEGEKVLKLEDEQSYQETFLVLAVTFSPNAEGVLIERANGQHLQPENRWGAAISPQTSHGPPPTPSTEDAKARASLNAFFSYPQLPLEQLPLP